MRDGEERSSEGCVETSPTWKQDFDDGRICKQNAQSA